MATKELSVGQVKKNTCDLIMAKAQAICRAAPAKIDKQRLLGVMCNHIMANDLIINCNPASILQSCADAMRYDWEIGVDCYLVPYKSKCALIPGWRGLVDLANRSGQLQKPPKVQFVFAGESFQVRIVDGDEVFQHDVDMDLPARKMPSKENVTHVYCVVKLKSGAAVRHYMSREQIEAHRLKYSKDTRSDSVWNTDWPSMAAKTLLRTMVNKRMLPVSTVDQRMIENETAIEDGRELQIIDGDFSQSGNSEMVANIIEESQNTAHRKAEAEHITEPAKGVDMRAFEAALKAASTLKDSIGLYDATFGPDSPFTATDEQRKEGAELLEIRKATIKRGTP